MRLSPISQPCPNCGATPDHLMTEETGLVVHDRGGCSRSVLFILLWIATLVAVCLVVPRVSGGFGVWHWMWEGVVSPSYSFGIGWFHGGGWWHTVLVLVGTALVPGILFRVILRIRPRDQLVAVCESCGSQFPWKR